MGKISMHGFGSFMVVETESATRSEMPFCLGTAGLMERAGRAQAPPPALELTPC